VEVHHQVGRMYYQSFRASYELVEQETSKKQVCPLLVGLHDLSFNLEDVGSAFPQNSSDIYRTAYNCIPEDDTVPQISSVYNFCCIHFFFIIKGRFYFVQIF
jgi:hypothetical protein